MQRTAKAATDFKRSVREMKNIIITVLALLVVVFAGISYFATRPPKPETILPARVNLSSVALSISVYRLDTGQFPASLQSLIQDDGVQNWDGSYCASTNDLFDSWKNPIHYLCDGTNFTVRSAGADGIFNTVDDKFVTKQ